MPLFKHLPLLKKYSDRAFETFYQKLLQDDKLSAFFDSPQQIAKLILKQKENFVHTLEITKEDIKKNYIDLGKFHYDINIPYINFIHGAEILEEDFLLQLRSKEFSNELIHEVLEYFKMMKSYSAKGYLRRMLRKDREEIEHFVDAIESNSSTLPKALILKKLDWLKNVMSLIEHARPLHSDIERQSKEWFEEAKTKQSQILFLKDLEERIQNDTQNLFYFLKKEEYREVLPLYSTLFNVYKLLLTMSDTRHSHHDTPNENEVTLHKKEFFNEIIRKEFAFAKRHSDYSFALVYLSCDAFENIVKQYGQDNASRVLKHLGQTILEHIRTSDYAFYIHENRFAIILKHAKRYIARKIVKKIATQLSQYRFLFNQDILHATLSAGIIEQSESVEYASLEELLEEVEQHLKRAHAIGDEQIVV
jgi:diguanylate cyclase (GGDEF)-like protein